MDNLECDRAGRIRVGVVDGSPSASSVRDTLYGRAVRRVAAVITMANRYRIQCEIASSQGFQLVKITGSGHLMFRHTRTGTAVVTSATPSDYRSTRNFKSLCARVNRKGA